MQSSTHRRLAAGSSSPVLSPCLSLGRSATGLASGLLSSPSACKPASGAGRSLEVATSPSTLGEADRACGTCRDGGRRLTLARLAEAARERPAALLRMGAVGRAPKTSNPAAADWALGRVGWSWLVCRALCAVDSVD